MTSKERVKLRLKGEKVDRIPNFNIFMGFAARYAGIKMGEFCTDYIKLTYAIMKTTKAFGIDVLSTMSDPYRETADFGAEIFFPTDATPICKTHLIKEPSDVKKLKVFDPHLSERTNDRIKAITEFKKQCGDEYPIMGWVEGAVAECSDLCGLSELAYLFYDEPQMVEEILEICCEQAILFAKAQIEAGADIIGVGDAALSVFGPDIYEQYGYKYEKRLFEEIKKMGAISRLHICGNITPILDKLATVGADIIDVDWMVDFVLAKEKLGKVAINGNFDPVAIILDGNIQLIEKEVQRCIAEGGNNSFIMAGCEIPVNSPHENLMAVANILSKNAE